LQFQQVVKRLSGNDFKIEITENAVEGWLNAGFESSFWRTSGKTDSSEICTE
jgi:hypothetical protein